MIEELCRKVCQLKGIDPDQQAVKLTNDGWNGWEVGQKYELWQYQIPIVELILNG